MTNRIIINKDSKYQKKIKVRPKQELYNYLSSRNFNNFLEPLEETNKTETTINKMNLQLSNYIRKIS